MKQQHKTYIYLVLVMMVWGSSWTVGKMVTSSAPADTLVFWRFLFTAVSLVPFIFIFRQTCAVSALTLAWLTLGGAILFLYNVCFFSGLHNGLAGAGGMLVTTMNPILTYFLTAVLLKQKSKPRQIIALASGFTGGLIMLQIWKFSLADLLKSGNLLFLVASLLWAFLTLISNRLQKSIHFIVYSFYIYTFATLFSLISTLVTGNISSTPGDAVFWLDVIYLSLIVTSVATTFYFLCTSRLGSRQASSFIFIVPVSAVFLSWLILNEVPSIPTLIGGAMTITAVLLINSNK